MNKMTESLGKILIVDDEADIRNLIRDILEDEGYETVTAGTVAEAQSALNQDLPDLAILDIWLKENDSDGLNLLDTIKKTSPDVQVVMISGHGTIETAVTALKKGAYDFIEKPFKADRLLLMVRRAMETSALRRENQMLRRASRYSEPTDLMGVSPAIEQVRQLIAKVGPTNSRILISGEQGTGKNIAAHMIHSHSKRDKGPLIHMFCATMAPERFERELFGYEGPDGKIEKGVLEKADGGTLVLDEVADMPLETQGKFVRVLQEQNFRRINGTIGHEVNVRVLATTNRDLASCVSAHTFREDLYFRLNVVPLHMPPLRERGQDIEKLAVAFMNEFTSHSGNGNKTILPRVMAVLKAYHWPGNVRQLKNAIEYMLIMSGNKSAIDLVNLPPDLSSNRDDGQGVRKSMVTGEILLQPLKEARQSFERDYLMMQLERFNGNVSQTARFVGMERSALHRKIKLLSEDEGAAEGEDDATLLRPVSKSRAG